MFLQLAPRKCPYILQAMRTEANRLAKVNFGPEMLQTIGYIYARAGAKVGLLLARAAQCFGWCVALMGYAAVWISRICTAGRLCSPGDGQQLTYCGNASQ